jgi:MmeI, DNA-methyltransferase domain/MmeI, N-terminal domain/MmeI, helicase spacer domain/MmeI, target recognition domain
MDESVEKTVEEFIARWQHADGGERANYQLFLTELCALLGLDRPDPASVDTEENAYVFERKVTFRHADGTTSNGYIDLYRRGTFVCEAKQTNKELDSKGWDNAMLRAHGQAQQYARALPAGEGRPPFLILVDVGRNIELYAEFTRSGATYVPYPDPRSHRIRLDDLRKSGPRETLRAIWNEPLSLDPARRSARVTREIAAQLATLAKSLEAAGHGADGVAAFLMRCLFTMFAEDVGLLPERGFTGLLEETRKQPELFPRLMPGLWLAMNHGGFSAELRTDVLKFNGGLFADPTALPLDKTQIDLLLDAARADWRHVEPAIFGTLLERALDPLERHQLGAHYTPRAYVERLVMPTVIEPLREDWAVAQATALQHDRDGKRDKAVAELRAFHRRLCQVRVLDPACGSGNFLYVTLEHLKRLEGEVLNALEALGETQGLLELAGVTVDPHQMLGLETIPRAARVAEAVLWIGYLQWHFRTHGRVNPPEPVLRDFHNIECRDAVLAWDRIEHVIDERGIPVTRWDGRTTKTHPVTGEQVPDETACVLLEQYVNPRKAEWPQADFVVGNPPFIGAARMRLALGDGYVESLRATYPNVPNVPESADYVMYWWHHAAGLARNAAIRRFGLITTNSLRQTFNRRVVQHHMEQKQPLSLVFAIPDHPWVDSADGAAVRIAMTVGEVGDRSAILMTAISEQSGQGEGREVVFARHTGKLHANLKLGADIAGTFPLISNIGISHEGVKLHGMGFVVTTAEAERLGLGHKPGLERYIRQYRNGKDLTQTARGVMVIDLFGLSEDEVRNRFPEVYQWVIDRVKPEREAKSHSKDGAGYLKRWWQFGKPRSELRPALEGISGYMATVKTAKHRFFTVLDSAIVPDSKLIVIALDDTFLLGVLSSRLHCLWALEAGARLGVGNDPTYVKTRSFETFPFPNATDAQQARIRALAEQLDAHRKRQQALHPGLTLTGMYNVLEKLRQGATLTAKDKTLHEQGLVSVLAQLHDELDAAVFDAYGWSDLAPALVGKPGGTTPYPDKPAEQAEAEEELLSRLVALNAERAAEEARGLVRWLRPEFQNPGGAQAAQGEMDTGEEAAVAAIAQKKLAWPKTLPEQVQALRGALVTAPGPLTTEQLARGFTRAQTRKVQELLETLVALGQVHHNKDGCYIFGG